MTEAVKVETIAETIWRAELKRATGRDRNVSWGEINENDRERYRFIAREVASLAREPQPVAGAQIETWASINQWCDDTFGKATIPQIIKRAKEEFEELEEDGANHAIEAADVVICLCRIPGFADALQAKMAINRKRKWRLVGDGTGYHIPAALATPSPRADEEQPVAEIERDLEELGLKCSTAGPEDLEPGCCAACRVRNAAITPPRADREAIAQIDPRTNRPLGDYGTANQAIDWALEHESGLEMDAFLRCWREGNLDEWPEFYEWLAILKLSGERE